MNVYVTMVEDIERGKLKYKRESIILIGC